MSDGVTWHELDGGRLVARLAPGVTATVARCPERADVAWRASVHAVAGTGGRCDLLGAWPCRARARAAVEAWWARRRREGGT